MGVGCVFCVYVVLGAQVGVSVGVWVRGWGCVGVWVCGCVGVRVCGCAGVWACGLSVIHISEPTRLLTNAYADTSLL